MATLYVCMYSDKGDNVLQLNIIITVHGMLCNRLCITAALLASNWYLGCMLRYAINFLTGLLVMNQDTW